MIRTEVCSKEVFKMEEDRLRIFSGTVYNFITLFLVVLLSTVNTIIIANFVGPELYGNFSIGRIIIDLLTVLCSLGLTASLIRFIPDFLIKKRFGFINSAISTGATVILLVTLILTVSFFFASPYIATNIFGNYWVTPILQLITLTFPTFAIYVIIDGALNGFQKFNLSMSMKVMMVAGYLLFVLVFLNYGYGVEGVIYALAIGNSVADIFGLYFLNKERKKIRVNNSEVTSFKIFDKKLFREMLGFGKWQYGISLVDTAFYRLNELMIGVFLIGAFVGIYRIGLSFATMLGFLAMAIQQTLNPYLSELNASDQEKKILKTIQRSTEYSTIFTLIFAAPAIVFAYQLLDMFFISSYLSATEPMRILVLAFVLGSMSGPIRAYFFAKKKLWINFVANGSAFALTLVLSVLLIPNYGSPLSGINGAAVALLVGYSVNLLEYILFARRFFGISIVRKKAGIWLFMLVLGIVGLIVLSELNFLASIIGIILFEAGLILIFKEEVISVTKLVLDYTIRPSRATRKMK